MRRGKKSVVLVAQCITALLPVHSVSSLFESFRMYFASLIHLVLLSDSQSEMVDAGQ